VQFYCKIQLFLLQKFILSKKISNFTAEFKLLINNMKKNYCFIALIISLVAVITSCTHNESTITDKLQQYVSNDVDFVIAGDLQQMLEVTDSHTNTDGKVTLSEYMQKLIATMPSSVRNNISDVLDAQGLDWSTAVCGIRISDNEVQTLNIFSVSDAGDFADYFVDTYQFKKNKQDGFVTVSGDDFAIVMRDNLAFFATHNDRAASAAEAINVVNDWSKQAKSKNIADWKCKYLDDGNVISAMFNLSNVCRKLQDEIDDADFWEQTRPQTLMLSNLLPEARKLIVGATFNIKGLTATLNGKFFTQEGDAYNWQNIDGNFNSGLLKYATDNDVAAIGVANASNLTALLGQSFTGLGSEIITKWLGNFNGSMMLAVGVNTPDMAKILDAPTNNLHLVLAVDCKAGKAQQALDTFASLMSFSGDANITKHIAGQELRFSIPTTYKENPALESWEDGYYTPVYTNFVMKADGDVLLLSNNEIDPTPVTAFTADMFKNKYAMAVINLPANSNMIKALHANFGADVRLSIEKSQFEAKITLTNSKKNFIEVLVDIMQNA
jgi:hypothetical protein